MQKKKPQKNISAKTVQTIATLIEVSIRSRGANATDIPHYVLKLFDCIRMNCCQSIQMSLKHFQEDDGDYKSLSNVFVENHGNEREWLRLDMMSKLFIVCPTIIVYHVRLSTHILQKLFTFCQNVINKSRFIQLNRIVFQQPNESLMSIKNVATKWYDKFDEINFILVVDTNENTICFSKTT